MPADLERPTHKLLRARRDALLRRLDNLPSRVRDHRGCRTARNLLYSKYLRAELAARAEVLETAQFMIEVLERIPPFRESQRSISGWAVLEGRSRALAGR